MSRRLFLGTSLAVTAAGVVPGLGAAERDDSDLVFLLSEDGRDLTIQIAQVTLPTAPSATANPNDQSLDKDFSWRLDARVFGPNATFALGARGSRGISSEPSYILKIRNVRYGRDYPSGTNSDGPGRLIEYHFFLAKNDDGRIRWRLRVETNLWSSGLAHRPFQLGKDGHDEYNPADPSDLREFQKGQKLRQWISADRVTGTLRRVFNGIVSSKARVISLYFHADGTWELGPTPGGLAILAGLHPDMRLGSLHLRWMIAPRADSVAVEGAAAPELFKVTEGAVGVQAGSAAVGVASILRDRGPEDLDGKAGSIPLRLEFGSSDARAVLTELDLDTKDSAEGDRSSTLVLRCGEEDEGLPLRATAVFERNWTVTVERNKAVTGPLVGVAGRLRLDSTVAYPAKVDDGANFTLDYTFDGDFVSAKPRLAATPAGRLTLSGIVEAEQSPGTRAAAVKAPFRNMQSTTVRWLVTQRAPRDPGKASLQWFEATVHLLQAHLAPQGAQFSSLNFDKSELVLVYARRENAVLPRGSFVRLADVEKGGLVARFDLSRAQLRAGRTHDLLSLRFRFSQLALEVLKGKDGFGLEIVNASEVCGVIATGDFEISDAPAKESAPHQPEPDEAEEAPPPIVRAIESRPVLVVEFPPQHIFEEALFVPDPEALPDANANEPPRTMKDPARFLTGTFDADRRIEFELKVFADTKLEVTKEHISIDPDEREQVLSALAMIPHVDDRRKLRRLIRDMKAANDPTFATFAKNYALNPAFGWTVRPAMPRDQRVYIGPFGLDPDSRLIARKEVEKRLDQFVLDYVEGIFTSVRQQAGAILVADRKTYAGHEGDLSIALRLERRLESVVPAYQQFRAFYRDKQLEELAADPAAGGRTQDIEFVLDLPASQYPQAEPPVDYKDNRAWGERPKLAERETAVRVEYVQELKGRSKVEGLVEGRLSEPSRIAFHITCRDGLKEARARVSQIDHGEDDAIDLGRNRLAYTLDSLTDWSSMELSVIRRAQRVYAPGRGGRLDPDSKRVLDLSMGGRLDQLGFASGIFVTAAMRAADISKSLGERPGPWETELVIPSRLSLSPSNEGVFLSRRKIPRGVFAHREGEKFEPQDRIRFGPSDVKLLWSAWLDTDDTRPEVRAVHSPDLRPDFVWSPFATLDAGAMTGAVSDELGRLPGSGPPIAGNIAPWLIGREQTIAGNASAQIVAKYIKINSLDQEDKDALTAALNDPKFCDYVIAHQGTPPGGFLPRLIEYLCRREPPERRDEFRNGLSANDRHQLVVLSSAYGLPMMGGSTDQQTSDSSSAKPDERHELVDIMPRSTLYNPRPLEVTELSLSALGGSLRHATSFEPPVSARHISGRDMYDALSIERWQQWTVLGRDVFSEVVYKGFLFPLGHRAALVKVTQRTFMRDRVTKLIRAYLRQHMFIRVSKPEKQYPATLQPNGSRRFPAGRVRILTEATPDIVDPYNQNPPPDTPRGKVMPSGRIWLGSSPGLAFWPRTLQIPGTEVRFQLALNEVHTELPLIFIDNIAANNDRSVNAVLDYYNEHLPSPDDAEPSAGKLEQIDTLKHMRTMRLGGQGLRYAPEIKTGSASFDTESWTLIAEGKERRRPEKNAVPATDKVVHTAFKFDNTDYFSTPVMQSADQPPFFPAVETARVHLRQNERFTGKKDGAVRAVFDAHYVANDLPLPQPLTEAQAATEEAQKSMDQRLAEASSARGNGQQIILDLIDQPSQDMGAKGDQSGGMFRPAGPIVALSRANGPITTDTVVKPAPGENGRRNALSLAEVHTARPRDAASDSATVTREISKIYDSMFSNNAKILGLVKVRDVLRVLAEIAKKEGGLEADPATGVPRMLEQIHYGIGEAASDGADATQIIRERVLKPLAAEILSIREHWTDLDKLLRQQQSSLAASLRFEPLTLDDLFPGIGQGLNNLQATMEAAAAETNDLLFALALSPVYEAGQRFLDAVQAAATDSVQVFEEALKRQFASLQAFLKDLDGQLNKMVLEFAAVLKDEAKQQFVDVLTSFVVPLEMNGEADYPWRFLPLPLPGFATLWNGAFFREMLYPTSTFMRDVVSKLIEGGLSGTPLNDMKLGGFLGFGASSPIDYIKAELINRANLVESAIPATALAAQNELTLYRTLLADPAALIEEQLQSVALVINKTIALRDAIKSGDLRGAVGAGLSLLTDALGPIDLTVQELCGSNFVTVIKAFVGRLQIPDLALAHPRIVKDKPYDAGLALQGKIDPNYPPAADDEVLSSIKEAIDEIATAVGAIKQSDIGAYQQKLAGAPTAVKNATARIIAGIGKLRRSAGTTQTRLATTYAGLVKDALAVAALQPAIDKAIADVPEDACDPKLASTLEGFDQVGVHAKSFGEARQALLLGLSNNLSDMTKELEALLRDPDVQLVLGVGALGLQAAQFAKNNAPALQTAIETSGRHLARHILRLLQVVTKNLSEVTAALIAAGNTVSSTLPNLPNVISVTVDGLDGNITKVTQLHEFLLDAQQKIDAELLKPANDITLESLAKLKTKGDVATLVHLYSMEASAEVNLSALAEIEKELTDRFGTLVKLYRQRFGAAKAALSARLDGLVYDILDAKLLSIPLPTVKEVRPNGFANALYTELGMLKDKFIDLAPAGVFREKVRATLSIAPRADGFPDAVQPTARLEQDRDRLAILVPPDKSAAKPISDAQQRRFLQTFLSEWQRGESTPEQMLGKIKEIFADLVRGDFLQLIDLPALRRATEEYLLSLVPSKIELSYGFKTAMSDKLKTITAGIFEPGPNSQFTVDMKAVIDFVENGQIGAPKTRMKSVGRMGPFTINLVGSFDAVKIKFSGAEFITETGSKPKFTIEYDDVIIGPELEFVQALQAYFNPSSGNPFRLVPSLSPLGILAKYNVDIGIVAIGTVSFFNVSIEASALLPFTDDDARFRGSLSRREAPFTVSVAPYGGSGFFAIEANTDGIVGFEASFEFGGAAAFAFGPLTGQGRLMFGVYVRQQKLSIGRVTEISATFFCGGSANIWVFSFGASLYLRMGMVNGNMSGEAVFTFSFSMGIKDFEYSVTMWKQEGKGFSSQRASTGTFQVAGDIVDLESATNGLVRAFVETDVVGPRDWRRYNRYFDLSVSDSILEEKWE